MQILYETVPEKIFLISTEACLGPGTITNFNLRYGEMVFVAENQYQLSINVPLISSKAF